MCVRAYKRARACVCVCTYVCMGIIHKERERWCPQIYAYDMRNQFLYTHRCPDPKCGKWSVAVCAVRKVARERLAYPYFVRERSQGRKGLGR